MKIIIDEVVEKFIKSSPTITATRIIKMIQLLRSYTYQLSMPYAKKITGNLFELRIKGKQEIRIFYTFKKEKVILFHIFTKKTNKIPQRELKIGINKLKNLK